MPRAGYLRLEAPLWQVAAVAEELNRLALRPLGAGHLGLETNDTRRARHERFSSIAAYLLARLRRGRRLSNEPTPFFSLPTDNVPTVWIELSKPDVFLLMTLMPRAGLFGGKKNWTPISPAARSFVVRLAKQSSRSRGRPSLRDLSAAASRGGEISDRHAYRLMRRMLEVEKEGLDAQARIAELPRTMLGRNLIARRIVRF